MIYQAGISSMKGKFLFGGYIVTILGLFFYSFTQVDLGLTFSRITFLRDIVTAFQHIGYFERPLSTAFYIILLVTLHVFYFIFLFLAYKKQIHKKRVWTIILTTAVILTFSYNAFSYDIFNYMFDAKIVTQYQQNPYVSKALDFPNDPMLSFMRWTHRVYPYGPVWLTLTVPLSFVGLNVFLTTFFLFKLLMAASFVGSLYFIGKILQKVAPQKEVFGLVFFGLQPLVLIESLVSAHLDIVMMFFALWGFYVLLQKKYVLAFLLLGISIGIKFATIFLLPMFVVYVMMQKRKDIRWSMLFNAALIFMVATAVIASVRTNFQPWYLVPVLTFAVFIAQKYWVLIPSAIVSFFALLTYVPYLYLGNWDPPVPEILLMIYITSYVLSLFVVIFYSILKQKVPFID